MTNLSLNQLYSRHYNPAGDATVLLIALTLLILSVAMFTRNRQLMRIYRSGLLVMSFSAVTNLIISKLSVYDCNISIIVLRMLSILYYLSLGVLLGICVEYISVLTDRQGMTEKIVKRMIYVCFIIMTFLYTISGFTGFGIFENKKEIYQSFISPFDFFYLSCISVIVFLACHYRKSLYTKIRLVLFSTIIISVIVYLLQKLILDTSLITVSFLLPAIAMFVMTSANPYKPITGTLSTSSFDQLLKSENYLNYTFIIAELIIPRKKFLPKEIEHKMALMWDNDLKGNLLFRLSENKFLLCANNKNGELAIRNTVLDIAKIKLEALYEYYGVEYKVEIIDNSKMMVRTLDEFSNVQFRLSKVCESNQYLVASDEWIRHYKRRSYILSQLESIAKDKNLNDPRVIVVYQPIKDLVSGKCDTVEALMRLELEKLGTIYPEEFIPLAEESDTVYVLSRIILHKACACISTADCLGIALKRISVNFTITELKDGNFPQTICEIIENQNITPDKIGIEVSESADLEDEIQIVQNISKLKQTGFTLYLDDFGAGYSNLARVLELDLDIIKFDRSMLLYAQKHENAAYMMQKFSEVFHRFGYQLLFEGVETTEQARLCEENQADYLQGFLYEKPILEEELLVFLQSVS